MAGIGFTLRHLTEQDNLLGIVQGYVYAAFITVGPWLFTILCLATVNALAQVFVDMRALSLFRLVVIYNFSFSLVLCGPITIIVTRYLADRTYDRQPETAPGALLGGLALIVASQTPLAVLLYGWYADLTLLERVAAIWNYVLVAGIWLVGVFLTALKDYKAVSLAFAGGMAVAAGAAWLLVQPLGMAGLLLGFDVGLAVILFVLVARVFGEYPYPPVRPFAFLPYFRLYPTLAFSGLIGNAALWVDKWVMWLAPNGVTLAGLRYNPIYDSGMFLAYLTVIPAMALFVLHVETRFFSAYQAFFSGIRHHAPYRRIARDHRTMVAEAMVGLRNVAILQGALAAAVVMLAPKIFDLLGLPYLMIGIFRFGVIAALLQVLMLFMATVLTYLDLRRHTLTLHILFFLLNGVLTWWTMGLGLPYYGLGALIAAAVMLVIAYTVTFGNLIQVPYLVFIANNPSVRGSP
ncbi:exopolysaccharide Pel transporter PelG [Roseospira goensis]|uniref:Putative membrane protein n=1 Tax=Roseospira goensis TaxID=391922 RepID=A0A7W6WL33_9PROT|nr:exopolysaccharide Pel transporter PelG [Roseospira goensis]MBB4285992.1 putative membrane protein [Roseospira goensis]